MRAVICILNFFLVTGWIKSTTANELDRLLAASTTGCFEMSAFYADSKDHCTRAEEYNGKIYSTEDRQYAEYSFATVFSDQKHHLLLNHIEKNATLSLQEQNAKSSKGKSKKLKIEGVEILPAQLEYYVASERIFEDSSRAVVIAFRNAYVIYHYVLVNISPAGQLTGVLYKYSNDTEWQYSELVFTGCSSALAGELSAKAALDTFLQKEGKEAYQLKPPYSTYNFHGPEYVSERSKRGKP